MQKIGFTITADNGYSVEPIGNLNLSNAFALCFQSLFIFYTETMKSWIASLDKEPTEEESKEFRASVYDDLVLRFSDLANIVYPEHQELDKETPEALLEHMSKEAERLQALRKA